LGGRPSPDDEKFGNLPLPPAGAEVLPRPCGDRLATSTCAARSVAMRRALVGKTRGVLDSLRALSARDTRAMPECPFCVLAGGGETRWNVQADVVLRAAAVTAFVSPKWWDAAPAHVIVVPNAHVERIADLPEATLGAVYSAAQRVARALCVASGCEGTSTRQHDGHAAGQDVPHVHVHVFPRHAGDRLYERDREIRWVEAAERAPYAARLRAAL
jgi:histidine triad (HIT) family protein